MSENILSPDPAPSPSESDPTVVPNVAPVPKKSPILLFIVLVLLSIVSVLAIYLFLQVRTLTLEKTSPAPTPTPLPIPIASADPTASWKTYTNEEYNFSFKYPQSFNYLTEDEDFTDGDFKGVVIVQNFPRSKTPNYSENATFQMLIYVKRDIGDTANQESLASHGGNGAYINKVKNGYVYRINFTLNKTDNVNLPDQILSTLQFTNAASDTEFTCPANGWQSCMPILSEEGKRACSKEAMDWYEANCPDFQGAAL